MTDLLSKAAPNYASLIKDLLNFTLEEKQKYLAHPKTPNGMALLDVLNNIIDTYSAEFKDQLEPESKQTQPR